MRMRLFGQVLLAAAILGGAALAYQVGDGLVPAGGQAGAGLSSGGGGRPAARVVVEPVVLRPEATRLEAIGTGEAIRSASLHPDAAGTVVAVHVRPDQRVAQGDVLLELDARRETLALDLAKAREAEAERLLRRYETAGRGAVPASTVDEARTALEAARIARREAEVALEDRRLTAPFPGHVGFIDADVGDRVTPDQPVTTLDDRSALLVRFSLPESALGRIAVGKTVEIAPLSSPDASLTGRLIDIGSQVDPATRSVTVRARLDNPDAVLRPGMSFAVGLDLTGSERPLVPEIAVQWGADGPFLWVVRGGEASREPVRIIQRREGVVLVAGALDDGELVVVEGIQGMREGIPVTLVDPPARQPAPGS
jgi:RND family efflux transporter MFP subunit